MMQSFAIFQTEKFSKVQRLIFVEDSLEYLFRPNKLSWTTLRLKIKALTFYFFFFFRFSFRKLERKLVETQNISKIFPEVLSKPI